MEHIPIEIHNPFEDSITKKREASWKGLRALTVDGAAALSTVACGTQMFSAVSSLVAPPSHAGTPIYGAEMRAFNRRIGTPSHKVTGIQIPENRWLPKDFSKTLSGRMMDGLEQAIISGDNEPDRPATAENTIDELNKRLKITDK